MTENEERWGKLGRKTRKSEESYDGKRGKVRNVMTTNDYKSGKL